MKFTSERNSSVQMTSTDHMIKLVLSLYAFVFLEYIALGILLYFSTLSGHSLDTFFFSFQRQRLLDNTERLERSSKRLEAGYKTCIETGELMNPLILLDTFFVFNAFISQFPAPPPPPPTFSRGDWWPNLGGFTHSKEHYPKGQRKGEETLFY